MVHLWAYKHFSTLAFVVMSHSARSTDSWFAVSLSAELLVSVFKELNWSEPEFNHCLSDMSSIMQLLHLCTSPWVENAFGTVESVVLVLCGCALLCTKCFLNAFSIHWRAIKSFHHDWVLSHWMFWLNVQVYCWAHWFHHWLMMVTTSVFHMAGLKCTVYCYFMGGVLLVNMI